MDQLLHLTILQKSKPTKNTLFREPTFTYRPKINKNNTEK